MQFTAQELALIAAIHADPKNDVPRLAYADWLGNNEQSDYSRLIHLQIARYNLSPIRYGDDCPDEMTKQFETIELATKNLLKNHWEGMDWTRPLSNDLELKFFLRGLPVVAPREALPTISRLKSRLDRLEAAALESTPRVFISMEVDENTSDCVKVVLDHPIAQRLVILSIKRQGARSPAHAVSTINALHRPELLQRLSYLVINGQLSFDAHRKSVELLEPHVVVAYNFCSSPYTSPRPKI